MDFKSLNLNQYGLDNGSPISRAQDTLAMDFETNYDVQLRQMRLSQSHNVNFINLSTPATATGSFTTGQKLFVTTSLTPNVPHQNYPNFALPYIAIYQGTINSAAFQIYPVNGASVTFDNYKVIGDFDYQGLLGTSNASFWSGEIENVAAGAVSVYFITQWKIINYNQAVQS